MNKLFIALILLAGAPAYALLSPLNQSIAELKGIIENDDLTEYLPSSEKILAIDAVEQGYLIRTQNYTMLIQIVFKRQDRPGPAKYELIFHEPIKIRS